MTELNESPHVPFHSLKTVWFQITGTVCNLRCTHCFISCAPDNDKFGFISLEEFTRHLQESIRLGADDFYFTGGEPFAHPDIYEILTRSLRAGSTTVLTNGMLFRDDGAEQLARSARESGNPFEVRLSIDGCNAEMNDAIRGKGTFDKAMQGMSQLLAVGIHPIVTISRTWDGPDCAALAELDETLRTRGYDDPRLKILPMLRLGAEISRNRSYTDCERVTARSVRDFDMSRLICSSSRLVTDRGVWVCPILLDSPEARMGDGLEDTLHSYPLRHQACYTCVQNGAICANSTVTVERDTAHSPSCS